MKEHKRIKTVLSAVRVSESPGGIVKTQIAGAHPRPTESGALGVGVGICISNKFPGHSCISQLHLP